ncbi:hypothetical protein BCR43DRAFT_528300 [Syncephalastrum racemosum]|uniref:Zinc-finger domain-containing protein n=1 Tax=Syncephalastrum racemosum TaxID=13706 RepID=A0A1X2GZK6_SYNRA|nr:hypothetical protein BCR43DRAFT_528300 [Syncephalastrum racemosum]
MSSKPRTYVQTKLCFGKVDDPLKRKAEAFQDSSNKRQKNLEKITDSKPKSAKVHPPTCRTTKCSSSSSRVACTVIDPETETPCQHSFCKRCLKKQYGETLEEILSSPLDTNDPFTHRLGESYTWACPVCRSICQCSFCVKDKPEDKLKATSRDKKDASKKKNGTLPFSKPSVEPVKVDPPELQKITLLHAEEELWKRIYIREFIYRFGNYCDISPRDAAHLQNVQGNWRNKRLFAALSVQILYKVAHGTGLQASWRKSQVHRNSSGQPCSAADVVRRIERRWLQECGLLDLGLDADVNARALVDQLGGGARLTASHWQDMAEVLVLAGCGDDLPIPTLHRHPIQDHSIKIAQTEDQDNPSENDDDEDDDDSPADQVERFRSRPKAPLSTHDELTVIAALCDLLLMDPKIRQASTEESKNIKARETALKKERRLLDLEETRSRRRRAHLANRLQADSAVAKAELRSLDEKMAADRYALETDQLALLVDIFKSEKRYGAAGCDARGNTYWLLNDLCHQTTHNEARNNEPFWAYGVIVIGPGFEGDTNHRWWSVQGVEDMDQLRRWLETTELVMCGAHNGQGKEKKGIAEESTTTATEKAATSVTAGHFSSMAHLVTQLSYRVQYLRSLEAQAQTRKAGAK